MGSRKRAVLVGINYPGTAGELKGCLNDVARMRRCLVDHFGFDDGDDGEAGGIRVLADADPSTPPPTGANIRRELERLVADARPGDSLFFHYSGHGLQLPAEIGDDDDTGYDECIVPCDMNLIKDQDLTELVQKVPDGCLFTMVSDSCHSGGLIDKTKEQVGNSTKQSKAQLKDQETQPAPASRASFCGAFAETIHGVLASLGIRLPRSGGRSRDVGEEPAAQAELAAGRGSTVKNRSLPLPTFIQMLKEETGIKDDVAVGSIRMTLFHHFSDDASPKIKKFVKVMLGKLQHGHHGGAAAMGSRGMEFLKAKLEGEGGGEADALAPAVKQEVGSVQEVYAGTGAAATVARRRPPPPLNGVLISGCQTDQVSADATTPEGVSYGALSNAVQTILAEKRGKVSNKELVLRARELLSKQGYTQQPGLYCSDDHANMAFIC